MWGNSRAKLDYAALVCKPYSMVDSKKELSSKIKWRFFWGNGTGESGISWDEQKKHVCSVNLIGLFLKKERICGKFVPCFYFNLRTLNL